MNRSLALPILLAALFAQSGPSRADDDAEVSPAEIEACRAHWKTRTPVKFKKAIAPFWAEAVWKRPPESAPSLWNELCEKGLRTGPNMEDEAVGAWRRNKSELAVRVLKGLKKDPDAELSEDEPIAISDLAAVPPDDLKAFMELDTESGYRDVTDKLGVSVRICQNRIKAVVHEALAKLEEDKAKGVAVSDEKAKTLQGLGAQFGEGAAFDVSKKGTGDAAGSPGVGVGTPGGPGTGGTPPPANGPAWTKPMSPLEQQLNAKLRPEFNAELATSANGQAQLGAFAKDKVPLPSIVVRTLDSKDTAAFIDPSQPKLVQINSAWVIKAYKKDYPELEGMDDAKLQEFLLKNDGLRKRLVEDAQYTVLHEQWHVHQGTVCPVHGVVHSANGVPQGYNIAGEYAAFEAENSLFREKAIKNPNILQLRDNPFYGNVMVENARQSILDPDNFRMNIDSGYAKYHPFDLDAAIEEQKKKIAQAAAEKDTAKWLKLNQGLQTLEKTQKYYKDRNDEQKAIDGRHARADFLLAFAKSAQSKADQQDSALDNSANAFKLTAAEKGCGWMMDKGASNYKGTCGVISASEGAIKAECAAKSLKPVEYPCVMAGYEHVKLADGGCPPKSSLPPCAAAGY